MTEKGRAYAELKRFVGRWNTTGKILATDSTPEVRISGTDTYAWLPGEFFLLHTVNVLAGDDRNETFEVIGYDTQLQKYTLQHYDNKGNSGFMYGTYQNGVWTYLGDTLRFKGGFKKDDQEFSGLWEQSSDGKNWKPFIEIQLRKIGSD